MKETKEPESFIALNEIIENLAKRSAKSFDVHIDDSGQLFLKTPLRGRFVLDTPCLNKGTAFSASERKQLGLHGLLPIGEETMEQQTERAYAAFSQKSTDLERHIYLRALQDINETLFYRLLKTHMTQMLPLVYTPVVGQACKDFHKIYRKSRGLFISYPDQDRIEELLDQVDLPDVKIIVVSDGERILGLGDLGAGGMGIPIGKIALYTACGGINPGYCLPILLDTGTNSQERLDDPLYFGWRHSRVRGAEYDAFIDRFVQAVRKKFPNALLQWEDFAKDQARMLLDRYRDEVCSFNDDIQGTAAVSLAGFLSAVHVAKSRLKDQKIVFYGAGSAGTGIADLIVEAMTREGLTVEEARRKIWILDSKGLITEDATHISPAQRLYAQPLSSVKDWKRESSGITLRDVVFNAHPTALVGVSARPSAFTEEIVREMAQHVERPIIFPLSNPTDKCEAKPVDLINWTQGRAILATGSPFADIIWEDRTFQIGQCNNFYVFPAMGLAVLAVKATRVTDTMFLAAAQALSSLSPALKDPTKSLFPDPRKINEIAKVIALAVALQAQKEGLAEIHSLEKTQELIEKTYWEPAYPEVRAR